MSVWMKGERASRLLHKGIEFSKAYYNGQLIFTKEKTIYGTLYWEDTVTGTLRHADIETAADWALMAQNHDEFGRAVTLAFSFGTIDIGNIRGFIWNKTPDTAHKVTIVPAEFMNGFMNLTMDMVIPNFIKKISDGFLYIDSSLSYHYGNSTTNINIDIGSGCTQIGGYFMGNNSSFNKPIDLRNVTTIGDGFLAGNVAFNSPINLRNVVTIGTKFLYNCYAFNKDIDVSHVQTFGTGLLARCYTFNKPLVFTSAVSIGSLLECESYRNPMAFNQNLTIPANCQLGGFLYSVATTNCCSYSRTLTLEAGVTITGTFLNGVKGQFTIICNTDPSNIAGAGAGTFESMTTSTDYGDFNQYYGGTYGAQLVADFPSGHDGLGYARHWVAAT